MVPSLLALVGRDLLLYDPPRVLAWRALHDDRLSGLSRLASFLVQATAADRDPLASLLGGLAIVLSLAYLIAVLRGATLRVRWGLVIVAVVFLVILPTLGFITLGVLTGRPFGQDGGVVQLPLAIARIVGGESPYGADYSDSILGKESRASDFWSLYGGNPILHHHAYLPGTHLLMLPAFAIGKVVGGFDPRVVTLIAYALAAFLASRLASTPERGLAAAAVVALNPLAYWLQIFGANDILVVSLLLLALFVGRGRVGLAGALVGLACATKQLAWPFAPFILLHLSGVRSLGELRDLPVRRRVATVGLSCVLVFLLVVVPVAALNFHAFWGDIVNYNVGLPGADNYPLGGTPGFGFANFLIYFALVHSLKDYVPLFPSYFVLLPLGLWLLKRQLDEGGEAMALMTGSVALLASLYLSRVVHPNYLILGATLLPLAGILGARVSADVIVLPLLALSWAAEVVEHEVFRSTWEDALSVRLPAHLTGLAASLGPRAGPELSLDPLGLGFAALAAGVGIVYLISGVLKGSVRARWGLIVVAALVQIILPTLLVARVGEISGQPRVGSSSLGWDYAPWAPEPPREAWSQSFRRDPPRRLNGEAGLLAPGLLLAAVGAQKLVGDPRILTLAATGLVAVWVGRLASGNVRLLLIGAAILSPAAALGVTWGSPDSLILALVLLALTTVGRGTALVATLLGGLGAVIPRCAWAMPFASPRGKWGALALGYGALVVLGASGRSLGADWTAGRAGMWVLFLGVTVTLFWQATRIQSSSGRFFATSIVGLSSLVMPGTSALDLSMPLLCLLIGALADDRLGSEILRSRAGTS